MLLVFAILGSLASTSSVEASPCNIYQLSADCKSRSLRTVPENIPCNIVRIALQMNRLPAVDADDFGCFSSLRQLDLSTNEIRVIHPAAFAHLNSLTVLKLFDNFLPAVPSVVNMDKLLAFNIGKNLINDLSFEISPAVSRMITLNVERNNIREVPQIAFLVENIWLRNNLIATFVPSQFSNIQGVVHLDLSINSLAVISDFGPMTALKVLKLEGNRIERIHEDAFAGLLSLERLDLSYNRLQSVNSLCVLATVHDLNLRSNRIQLLPHECFTKFNNLKSLILIDNHLASFDCSAGVSLLPSLLLNQNRISRLVICENVTLITSTLNASRNPVRSVTIRGQTMIEDVYIMAGILEEIVFDSNSRETIRFLILTQNRLNNLDFLQDFSRLSLLDLSYNHIRVWNSTHFENCTGVSTVIMSHNGLQEISDFTFFPQMEVLDLSNNVIRYIHPGAFNNMPRLNSLDLSGNKLQVMPNLGCRKLQSLNLNGNDFRYLPSSAPLEGLPELRRLSLQHCHLVRLPSCNLPKLTYLLLQHNNISQVDWEMFSVHFSDVTYLILSDNTITKLSAQLPPFLTHLHIDGNRLTSVGYGLDAALTDMNFSSNAITTTKNMTVSATLRGLWLGDNLLRYITLALFLRAHSLNFLDLSANVISSLSSNSFEGLSNLFSLSLRKNRLTYLPPGLFFPCSKLAHLDVSANPLMNVSYQLFHVPLNLNLLDLSGTDLSLRQLQALDGNPAPGYVLLNNCLGLYELAEEIQLHLSNPTNTINLELTYNRLWSHFPIITSSNIRILGLSHNRFVRLPTQLLTKRIHSSLQVLDLSSNRIKWLPRDTFSRLPNLRDLYLSDNELQALSSTSLPSFTRISTLDVRQNNLTSVDEKMLRYASRNMNFLGEENPWICDCRLRYLQMWLCHLSEPLSCSSPTSLLHQSLFLTRPESLKCRPEICAEQDATLIAFGGSTSLVLSCPMKFVSPTAITWAIPGGISINITHNTSESLNNVRMGSLGSLLFDGIGLDNEGKYACRVLDEGQLYEYRFQLTVRPTSPAEEMRAYLDINSTNQFVLASLWQKRLQCGTETEGETLETPTSSSGGNDLSSKSCIFCSSHVEVLAISWISFLVLRYP
ncbi:uncharacterized protein [Diadema antillarum]|uniref:uncharacterized protein n=1 Tax=Diadema antillarum TaxID=105358 RepID=UPI003A8B5AF1